MSVKKTEFEWTIDSTTLKEVLSAFVAVVDRGVLRISEEGITSKAVNPENTAMVSLDIKRDVFTDYNLKGEESLAVGVDFGTLLRILKRCKGVKTIIKVNAGKVQMNSGYLSYDFPLITLDALRSEPKLPELEFSATVTIELEDFKQGIDIADTIIADYVEIGVNSGREFFMDVEGDEDTFKLVIPKEDLTLSNVDREVKSKFSIEYLTRMASAVVGELVTLKIRDDYPLQIPFKVTNGCKVTYLLAPRIDAD